MDFRRIEWLLRSLESQPVCKPHTRIYEKERMPGSKAIRCLLRRDTITKLSKTACCIAAVTSTGRMGSVLR